MYNLYFFIETDKKICHKYEDIKIIHYESWRII